MRNMRNECNDDYNCLENARIICDGDPKCFGISWQNIGNTKDGTEQKIGKCMSRKMKPNTETWRTIMKSTTGELSIKEYF